MVVTIQVKRLRYGDDVVCAVEARAFFAQWVHVAPLIRSTTADYRLSAVPLALVGGDAILANFGKGNEQ